MRTETIERANILISNIKIIESAISEIQNRMKEEKLVRLSFICHGPDIQPLSKFIPFDKIVKNYLSELKKALKEAHNELKYLKD